MPVSQAAKKSEDAELVALKRLIQPRTFRTAEYTENGLLKDITDTKTGKTHEVPQDVELGSTPVDLKGWESLGIGIYGPKGCKFENIRVERIHADEPLKRISYAKVTYDIIAEGLDREQCEAWYTHEPSRNLETLPSLEKYISTTGPTFLEAEAELKSNRQKGPHNYPAMSPEWRTTYWDLYEYTAETGRLQDTLFQMGGSGASHLLHYRYALPASLWSRTPDPGGRTFIAQDGNGR